MRITSFDHPDLFRLLEELSSDDLDALEFGIIGFDQESNVRRYNAFEAKSAGLSIANVVGHHLFTVVAPCMNNFMVAQRFEDAAESGAALDEPIDYVLTLRMRPSRVRLRLLSRPDAAMRYIAVKRLQ
jgi:photoactive yellow protein